MLNTEIDAIDAANSQIKEQSQLQEQLKQQITLEQRELTRQMSELHLLNEVKRKQLNIMEKNY